MQETYYLIDFENVGLKGLEGAQNLTKNDWVHLFSTRNAPKINTATLANFNATNLLVHEVPAKSQSVDMHLVSYLGYLLGSHETAPQIVILSNDTDYDDIVSFWNIEKGVIIRRRDKFQPEEPKSAAPKAAKSRKAAASKKTAPKVQEAHKETSTEKSPVKTRRTRKVRPGQDEAVKDSVKAAEGQESPEKDSVKADTSPKKSAKGRAKANDAQKKAAKSGAKTVEYQDKTTLNNAVLKTLSNAKYDNETVSFAASLVTKNFAEKGGKQTIYRTVISKFGQERGLAIYRHIQKLL